MASCESDAASDESLDGSIAPCEPREGVNKAVQRSDRCKHEKMAGSVAPTRQPRSLSRGRTNPGRCNTVRASMAFGKQLRTPAIPDELDCESVAGERLHQTRGTGQKHVIGPARGRTPGCEGLRRHFFRRDGSDRNMLFHDIAGASTQSVRPGLQRRSSVSSNGIISPRRYQVSWLDPGRGAVWILARGI